MQFLQAKNGDNKLDTRNNLPYAIDNIIIEEDDILLSLTSYAGNRIYVRYESIEDLKREFDVIDAIGNNSVVKCTIRLQIYSFSAKKAAKRAYIHRQPTGF